MDHPVLKEQGIGRCEGSEQGSVQNLHSRRMQT